jgi:hypothetical protein
LNITSIYSIIKIKTTMKQQGLHIIENNYQFSNKPMVCDRMQGLNVNCNMN